MLIGDSCLMFGWALPRQYRRVVPRTGPGRGDIGWWHALVMFPSCSCFATSVAKPPPTCCGAWTGLMAFLCILSRGVGLSAGGLPARAAHVQLALCSTAVPVRIHRQNGGFIRLWKTPPYPHAATLRNSCRVCMVVQKSTSPARGIVAPQKAFCHGWEQEIRRFWPSRRDPDHCARTFRARKRYGWNQGIV
eukprot:gene25222-biopygen1433